MPSHGWIATCAQPATATETPGMHYDLVGSGIGGAWTLSWVHIGYTYSAPTTMSVVYDNDANVRYVPDDYPNGYFRTLDATWSNYNDCIDADTPWWVTMTWDVATGELHAWVNGVYKGATSQTPPDPAPTPESLYVGYQVRDNEGYRCRFRHITLSNGVMSDAAIEELHALDPYYVGRHMLPTEAENNLLLYQSGYHGVDADYATGDPTAYWDDPIGQWFTDHVPEGRAHAGNPWYHDFRFADPTKRDGVISPWVAMPQANIVPDRLNATLTLRDARWTQDAYQSADPRGYVSEMPVPEGWQNLWAYINANVFLQTDTGQVWENDIWRYPVGMGVGFYWLRRFLTNTVGSGATASSIPLGTGSQAVDKYAGAHVDIMGGPTLGERALVASNDASSITLGGALSEAPLAGEDLRVISGNVLASGYDPEYGMWANMENSEVGGVDPDFPEQNGFLVSRERPVNYGDVLIFPDGGQPNWSEATDDWSGNIIGIPRYNHRPNETTTMVDPVNLRFVLRQYREGTIGVPMIHGALDEPFDNFMVQAEGTRSTRMLWQENLKLVASFDECWNGDPTVDVSEHFVEAGTWHAMLPILRHVEWDPEIGRYRALLQAQETSGDVETTGWGWFLGDWNETLGYIEWEEDPDADNPIITYPEFEEFVRSVVPEWTADSHEGRDGVTEQLLWPSIESIFQGTDGTWFWTLFVVRGGNDGTNCVTIGGARDRYSIPDRSEQPALLGRSTQYDVPNSAAYSAGVIGQEEIHYTGQARNRYKPGTPVTMLGRAQVFAYQGTVASRRDSIRLLAAIETRDGRSWTGISQNNSPIAALGVNAGNGGQAVHYPFPASYSANVCGYYIQHSRVAYHDLELHATDSRFFFANKLYTLLEDAGDWFIDYYYYIYGAPMVNEDRTVVYAGPLRGTDQWKVIWCDRGHEAFYQVADAETEASFVTTTLVRPDDGWEELFVNSDLGDGDITVAVFDAGAGDARINGYSASDMDALSGGIKEEVTWDGNSISELDEYEYLKLKVALTRPTTGDVSPSIYEWYCTAGQRMYDISSSSSDEIIISNSEAQASQQQWFFHME